MGCGCGGGGAKRNVQAPKLNMAGNSNSVTQSASRIHPNAEMVQNIQKVAEERRKIEKLRREHLLRTLLKP